MSEITIAGQKFVELDGVTMLACKTEDGKIHVGIKSICDGLGIDSNGQIQRINRDDILPEGACKIHVPTNQGIQEVMMLDIEYLPFFLVGIKSSMCREEVQPALKDFKLKAKDVLAAAFIDHKDQPKTPAQLLVMFAQQLEEQERINAEHQRQIMAVKESVTDVQSQFDVVKNELAAPKDEPWRTQIKDKIRKIAEATGDYQQTWLECYTELDRHGFDMKRRLTNRRNRMAKQGYSESEIKKVNKLDLIEEDPKAKEIFAGIVSHKVLQYAM